MNALIQSLNAKSVQSGLPLNGALELTPLCNLRCNMCYIHRPECLPSRPALRSLSFWLELAEALRQAGTLVLVVTGGETFLYPQAEPLLEALRAMGFLISLNTNGTLLDERRLDWLAELRPAKVNLSLYGASNETYARLCGCDDGFDRLRAALDGLLERGLNVCLNGTLTRENRGDVPAMAAFASARGLRLNSTAYLFPPGRYGLHACPSRLSPEAAAEATLELHGFREAWGLLRAAVEALPLPAACGSCPWAAVCNACPATLYNENGVFDRLASYPCAYVRAAAEARLARLRGREEEIHGV